MNPEIGMRTDYHFEKKVLELTSKGYSTREATRKIKRENKRKSNKLRSAYA